MEQPELAPPRRFRRRILLLTLLAGLLPALAWALIGRTLLHGFLSVSLGPLVSLLERVDGALVGASADPQLLAEVRAAQLNLVQAELVRHALERAGPRAFVALFVLSALLVAAGALLLGRALTRRVELLVSGMTRLARGEPSSPLPERAGRRDELDFLIARFNHMGAELQAQRERLRATEQLAAWQEVARSIAHDLKNPLTAMQMALARLGRVEGADPRIHESVELLAEELAVLGRMAESFSTFGRLPPPAPRVLPLAPLVEEVCALYRPASPVPLRVALEPGLEVEADPDQLRRALGNLLKNAVEASAGRAGEIAVSAQRAAGRIVIELCDCGSGIGRRLEGAELTRGLATTKAGGSGLGLPITQKIVHDHGGTLRLEPAANGGTRACIELPEARAPRGEAA